MKLPEAYSQKRLMSSTAIRRINADIKELNRVNNPMLHATPLEDNIFEWHFTIHGPPGTDYEEGIYHGRILLPSDWPMTPPKIIFTTVNGRFEVNVPVCLSFSSFHPEEWKPSWGIRTILEAIISFFPVESEGSIGSIVCSPEQRRHFAKESHHFCCPQCGQIESLIKPLSDKDIEEYYTTPKEGIDEDVKGLEEKKEEIIESNQPFEDAAITSEVVNDKMEESEEVKEDVLDYVKSVSYVHDNSIRIMESTEIRKEDTSCSKEHKRHHKHHELRVLPIFVPYFINVVNPVQAVQPIQQGKRESIIKRILSYLSLMVSIVILLSYILVYLAYFD